MLPIAEKPVNLDPAIIAAGLVGLPQTECPVVHHFSDGVYIREMLIPAGTFIVGHAHKAGGINFMLQGSGVLFVDGVARKVDAPQMIHAGAGAKMMHALTDVVWMNVFPNHDNIKDIDSLESRLVDKSDEFLALQKEMLRVESDSHIDDVASFSGVDESIIDALNSMPVVKAEINAELHNSPISGRGAFAPFGMPAGSIVGMYCNEHGKSELASNVNHAKRPNCVLVTLGGVVYIETCKPVHGRLGGMHGEELTIDYKTLPNFIEVKP